MEGGVLKLPRISLPRPTRWDAAAGVALAVSAGLAALNLGLAAKQPPGASISGALTALFVLAQFVASLGSLFLLGKTVKEGTLLGNLLAVAGLFAGMGGVLLAAALWATA
jgi:hypothetical protein